MQALLHSMAPNLQQVTSDPRLCRRLLDIHGQVCVSLFSECSFLLGPGAHKVLFVPSKSLFPQCCGSSVIKSHWPSKSISLGVLNPFCRIQVEKSVVGPSTFATVRELLWYNCSPVYGLSAWWLYGGAHTPLRSAAAKALAPAAGCC